MYQLTAEDYSRAISLDELMKAAKECVRGVKWKESTAKFYNDRLFRLVDLRSKLTDGTSLIGSYKIQNYIKFMTYDPKPREISATRIRDRALQRSLCNNGLYLAFTNPFIYDNIACQKGKGITKLIQRMKFHLKQYWQENHTNRGYCIKLDIHHYFLSTPHEELKKIVEYYIREPHFQKHVFQIIDSFEDYRPEDEISKDKFGRRGIGLGSQCSQLLLLLYLNDLDHYIKEQLKVKHYLRYMDDMLLIVESKEKAEDMFEKIRAYVLNKGLELNAKSKISRIEDGVHMCKMIYKLSNTGKVKTRVVSKTFCREIRRLHKYRELLDSDEIIARDVILHGNTWYGFAKWRCSGKQIIFMKDLSSNIFSQE